MAISSLRHASIEDAERLGAVHVASWRETYEGILPDEMLSRLTAEGRAALWSNILNGANAINGTAVLVAENDDGIVGFGSCGRQRDQSLDQRGFDAEISAIYILRRYQGAGLGRALMSAMASSLRDRGLRAATVWVLSENVSARGFYERLGGVLLAEKEDVRPHLTLNELAYGWHDLRSLGVVRQ
jgi:ribosomal protein S18 acetylase RimI-like enzyme